MMGHEDGRSFAGLCSRCSVRVQVRFGVPGSGFGVRGSTAKLESTASEIQMTTGLPRHALAPVIALSVLLCQVEASTQVNDARPAFAEASVKAVAPPISGDFIGRQRELTVTTFLDKTTVLHLIVDAYFDGEGAAACAWKTFHAHDCELVVGSAPP
jgi:hypothetical protein